MKKCKTKLISCHFDFVNGDIYAANSGETEISYDFLVLLELFSNLSCISMKILSRSLMPLMQSRTSDVHRVRPVLRRISPVPINSRNAALSHQCPNPRTISTSMFSFVYLTMTLASSLRAALFGSSSPQMRKDGENMSESTVHQSSPASETDHSN